MKTVYEHTDTKIIDGKEVSNKTSINIGKIPNQEPFIMMYGAHLGLLRDLNSITDLKILFHLLFKVQYGTNRVSLSTGDRKELIDSLCITTAAVSNSLSNLKKAGLLTGEKGSFMINPYLFWKGENKDRKKLLKTLEHGRFAELGGRGELFESHKGEQPGLSEDALPAGETEIPGSEVY